MKINNESVESFMTLKYNFVGIRVLEESLCPTSWNLNVDLVALERPDKTLRELEEAGSLAYQKIYFWMQSTLSNIIIVNTQNEMAMNIAAIVDNIMMHSPEEPTDDVLVQMIHSKLTAIADGNMHIGSVRLESTDTPAQYTFSPTPAHGYSLPTKMKDYVNAPALHRKPWWARKDGFCFELLKPKGAKGKLTELYKDVVDPLEAFEADLLDYEAHLELDTTPAEIIQVDKWVPKKV